MIWIERWLVIAAALFVAMVAAWYFRGASALPKQIEVRGWWITREQVRRFGVVLVGSAILIIGVIQGAIARQRKVVEQGGSIESVTKTQISKGRYQTGLQDVYSLKMVTDSGAELVADGMDADRLPPKPGNRVWITYDPDDGTVEFARLYSSAEIWVATYDIDQSELAARRWLLGLSRSRLNGLVVGGCFLIFAGLFLDARRAGTRFEID